MRRRLAVLPAVALLTLIAASAGGDEVVGACGPLPVRAREGGLTVRRGGLPVARPVTLRRGDRVRVRGSLALPRATVRDARFAVACAGGLPALDLASGRVDLRRAIVPLVLTPEAAVHGLGRGVVAVRRPRAGRRTFLALDKHGYAAVFARGHRRGVLVGRPREDLVVVRGFAPVRDVDPFPRSFDQRAVGPADRVPALWADGRPCSVGCRPSGVRSGWPLRPFHSEHPLRAGLNERRPRSLHVGIDIQSADRVRVYALQGGRAHIVGRGTVDVRVRVGAYEYWHVRPAVREGRRVVAYRTVLGRVLPGFRHVHLSERRGGAYENPLRPGGRVLAPWRDEDGPVIGRPYALGGGRLAVAGYDPQSYAERRPYHTPVLMPAGLAWREGTAGPLHFAYRGTQHEPFSALGLIFAPGAFPPGFTCFATRRVCRPRWNLVLTGGFAPRLTPGRHRLTVYAWDWAGNASARAVTVSGS